MPDATGAAGDGRPRPSPYGPVLRNRGFVTLWLAQAGADLRTSHRQGPRRLPGDAHETFAGMATGAG